MAERLTHIQSGLAGVTSSCHDATNLEAALVYCRQLSFKGKLASFGHKQLQVCRTGSVEIGFVRVVEAGAWWYTRLRLA
jgi:hypothetical protein